MVPERKTYYENLNVKNRLFIDEYLRNNFNGTRAYITVYGLEDYNSNAASASRLLNDVNVQNAIAERLGVIRAYEQLSPESLYKMTMELYQTSKQENTKARLLELMYRAKGMLKDNVQVNNVAVFRQVETELLRS
jgi:phage terminase small subunit